MKSYAEMLKEVGRVKLCPEYIMEVYPTISYISQMRFAGFDWAGYRLAGVVNHLHYDKLDGTYLIGVGAGLKLQVFLPLDDLMRYHCDTADVKFSVNKGFLLGEPLYILGLCFGFGVEWLCHFEVNAMSYIVAGSGERAVFNSLRLIEEFFAKNWNNWLVDNFAVRGRFTPFVDSTFFYARFFHHKLDSFTVKFILLIRARVISRTMRLWVLGCLRFFEHIALQASQIGRARSAVKSCRRLYFLGGSRALGAFLPHSRFRHVSAHFISDAHFVDLLLASAQRYYGLMGPRRGRLLKNRFAKVKVKGSLRAIGVRGRGSRRRKPHLRGKGRIRGYT